MIRRTARRAFTLLELILALAIGVFLLAGLYYMLNAQVQHAQSGRETLEDGTLARALLTRIANDILGHLGPVDPKVLPDPQAPTTTTPPAETTTPTTETPPTESTESTESTTSGTDDGSAVVFNNGVYGTSSVLVLAVSRVPRELNLSGLLGKGEDAPRQLVSDLRRISYWVAGSQEQPGGLARQELTGVTSMDLNSIPPDVSQPSKYIIAPEVRSISFQYFDGSSWQDTWDGTTLGGQDGETPIGPPAAIAITLELSRVSNVHGELVERVLSFRHVVAIPAGNNFSQMTP